MGPTREGRRLSWDRLRLKWGQGKGTPGPVVRRAGWAVLADLAKAAAGRQSTTEATRTEYRLELFAGGRRDRTEDGMAEARAVLYTDGLIPA